MKHASPSVKGMISLSDHHQPGGEAMAWGAPGTVTVASSLQHAAWRKGPLQVSTHHIQCLQHLLDKNVSLHSHQQQAGNHDDDLYSSSCMSQAPQANATQQAYRTPSDLYTSWQPVPGTTVKQSLSTPSPAGWSNCVHGLCCGQQEKTLTRR